MRNANPSSNRSIRNILVPPPSYSTSLLLIIVGIIMFFPYHIYGYFIETTIDRSLIYWLLWAIYPFGGIMFVTGLIRLSRARSNTYSSIDMNEFNSQSVANDIARIRSMKEMDNHNDKPF